MPNYTILDENGYVKFAQNIPGIPVPEMVIEWMVKPQFDFDTRTFSETATPEEWRQAVLTVAKNIPAGTDRDNFLAERGVILTEEEREWVEEFDVTE